MNTSVVRAPSRALAVLAALALAVSMLALAPAAFADAHEPDRQRLAGADRIETAADIALDKFDAETTSDVIIAAGWRFPDSLAANGLAGLVDAPILLVNDVRDEATSTTLAALDALDPDTLHIAGGTAAVSASIEAQLAAAGDWSINRFDGTDRFDTAAQMAEVFDAGDVDTAFVATGRVAADSLAAGPVAYAGNYPVLLTEVNTLPARTAELLGELDLDNVIILGGTAAVSASVEAEIEAAAGVDADRFAGATRAETAVMIAEYATANYGDHFDLSEVAIATGWGPTRDALDGAHTPADALSGGPYGGENGVPILPINDVLDTVPDATCEYLQENAELIDLITIFGGTAAVSTSVENELFECLEGDEVPIPDNVTFTDAPELVRVERDGDVVSFFFDQNVPGKSLDAITADGDAFDPDDDDLEDISVYTGLRLYDVEGTAYYPREAGIFGDEVRARFGSETIVAAAVRAGVYEDTVQNATGLSNPASDFSLRATLVAPDPIDEYYPQLSFVGDLRTTGVTPPEILVDFVFTFEDEEDAEDVDDLIDDGSIVLDEDDFAVVGSAGQVFRAEGINDVGQSGANVTVTVEMSEEFVEEVPETQLRRGFVEPNTLAFDALINGEFTVMYEPGDDHILLSTAWENIGEVNGTTSDPDLRAVERGSGANQMRFIFDEAVNVPEDPEAQADYYVVTDNEGNEIDAEIIGRSLIAADDATVMVATFDIDGEGFLDADGEAYDSTADYLDAVTAAYVYTEWEEGSLTDVDDFGAAQATNQTGSQQGGWNTPAQVLVTPVQPEVPADPTPGQTDLPDLQSVERQVNAVTGNWRVTFVFDQPADDVDDPDTIDFALYDEAGVRFSTASRDVDWDDGDDDNGTQVFVFGPDVGDTTFSNEQIEAAVLATVQDSDADLVTSPDDERPQVTEGHAGVE